MEFVQVVSVENMRKSDARTIAEHTPSAELMYRAAQGIFNSAKFVGKVAIVCGKGNNGGDGYALACVLCKNGFTPTIFRVSDGFSKDGLYYYKTAMSLGAEEMPMSQAAAFTGFDIVVDCLLGTGFSGELKGEMLEAVEQINMTNAYVISADINSGINGDTGVCSTAETRILPFQSVRSRQACSSMTHRITSVQSQTAISESALLKMNTS